jgi:hypothetical protein
MITSAISSFSNAPGVFRLYPSALARACFAFRFYLAKHPGRNTCRPCRIVGIKNRRDDYCGQGLLVLLARQKNTPGRAWQRVLFNCPYGHRKNQTYIAAKHPEHFYVKDNLGSTRAVVDEAVEVVEAIYRLDNGMVLTTGFKLYTCNPGKTRDERYDNTVRNDPNYTLNKKGYYNPEKVINSNWKLGAAYGGIRYRGRQVQFGANSEAILHAIQNNFHRLIGSPDFPWNVNAPTYGYYNYSSYNPYSLY